MFLFIMHLLGQTQMHCSGLINIFARVSKLITKPMGFRQSWLEVVWHGGKSTGLESKAQSFPFIKSMDQLLILPPLS